jgi:hypothetical protein
MGPSCLDALVPQGSQALDQQAASSSEIALASGQKSSGHSRVARRPVTIERPMFRDIWEPGQV